MPKLEDRIRMPLLIVAVWVALFLAFSACMGLVCGSFANVLRIAKGSCSQIVYVDSSNWG